MRPEELLVPFKEHFAFVRVFAQRVGLPGKVGRTEEIHISRRSVQVSALPSPRFVGRWAIAVVLPDMEHCPVSIAQEHGRVLSGVPLFPGPLAASDSRQVMSLIRAPQTGHIITGKLRHPRQVHLLSKCLCEHCFARTFGTCENDFNQCRYEKPFLSSDNSSIAVVDQARENAQWVGRASDIALDSGRLSKWVLVAKHCQPDAFQIVVVVFGDVV